MFDTENPVPRQEGPRRKHRSAAFKNIGVGIGGLGVGYAGLKIGKAARPVAEAAEQLKKTGAEVEKSIRSSLFRKIKARLYLQSKLREIHFAAGDYARKYLPLEPLLRRRGEEGYDPYAERQVKAALLHHRPESEKAKKAQGRELGKTAVLKSGYMPHDVEGKRRYIPGVKIERPYRKTRREMSQQARSLTEAPKTPELPPPEMLGRARGKTPVRGGDYEGVDVPNLWDPEKAKTSEGNIKYTYKSRQVPGQGPRLTPHEVSVKAREYRDPIAWHKARVKAGMTPNLIVERPKHIKNLPDVYLPHAEEVESRREAQAVRDELAKKLKGLRKDIIQPLRAKSRRLGYPMRPLSNKTMVAIGGGAELHPTVLARAQKQLHSEIAAAAAKHVVKANAISEHIGGRLQETFEKKKYLRVSRDAALKLKKNTFNLGRRLPLEDWEAQSMAEHVGSVTPEWVKHQHNQFVRHAKLGETGVGEKKIRSALMLGLFKRVSGEPPQIPKSGLISKAGKFLRKTLKFEAPGTVSALGNITKKLPKLTKVGKKELILGGALAGGITAADAATSAAYPDPDKTRGQSAWAGTKRGAIYGGVLAGTELPLRRALMGGGPPLIRHSSRLKEIQFKKNDDNFGRDVAVGGIEGGLGYVATDRLLHRYTPNIKGIGKFGLAAGVGGLATGTIGYGLNRFLRSFKQKHKEKKMAAKLREIRFRSDPTNWESEGYSAPYNPKRKLTVAQDRYRKLIRAHEIQRKESNLTKSAVAGAAIGGLLHGKLKLAVKPALAAGAAAGLGTEAALIAHGRKSRDPFGEESIASKRIERIPYQAAGLGVAGIAGHKLYKGLKAHKLFKSNGQLICFQDETPWHEKQAQRWLKYPVGRAKEAQKWYGRVSRIHRDIGSTRNKEGMIVDERGRERKPEWKKDWFKRSLVTGAIAAPLIGAGLIRGKLGRIAKEAGGAVEKGLHPSDLTGVEKFALHTTGGSIGRALKSKFPRTMGAFSGLSGQFGEAGKKLRSIREGAFEKANKAIESQTGEIQYVKLRKTGIGTERERTVGVHVETPGYRTEILKKLASDKEKSQAVTDRIARTEHRVKKARGAQKSIEDIIRKPDEPKFNSVLGLIHFQDGEVYVRPHRRKARRQKRPEERKGVREGFLAGAGAAGTITGAFLGGKYIMNRQERAAAAEAELKTAIEKRLAKASLAKEAKNIVKPIFKASALLDDIIQFKVSAPKTYLVRHGCTSFNKEAKEIGQSPDRIRGHMDVPLNKKGEEQAQKIGKKLKDKNIEHIYASDLSRAHETAAIMSEHMDGVPITPLYGLRPWALGKEIEGKATDKVQSKINKLVDLPHLAPQGGESMNTFKDRFLSTLGAIRSKHPTGNIAIVTHYRGIKLLDSLDGNGEVKPRRFKSQDGVKGPGSVEVIKHDQPQ